MRSKNSFLNIFTVILMQLLALVLNFVTRKLFLDNLSVTLLGVSDLFNGLFYSIGLIDIGFAAILVYNLYKPINEKDEEKVKWLVAAFKKIYFYIGLIIFLVSLIFMPFIYNMFIIEYDNYFVIYSSYIILLLNSVSKYFFIHKTNIVTVSQQKWKVNLANILLDFFVFILKAVAVFVFKSYIMYLLAIFMQTLGLNIINVYITNKLHPYLKHLPKVSFKEILDSKIIKQSKNFLYHVFYNFIYYSTDNFIIANKLGSSVIGYINNYMMIINIFAELISSIIISLRDSFANFLHEEKDIDGLFEIYSMTNIFNYFIVSVSIVGIYTMIDKFIMIWYDTSTVSYVIERGITIMLIVNLAIDLIFRPLENIYSIKGYVFKEKWPIFISALVNIVLSLLLVDTYGLIGIYFGTFVGKLVFWWGKLYYVTNDVFKTKKMETIIGLLKLVVILTLQVVIINYIADYCFPNVNNFVIFILRGVLCVLLTLCSTALVFYKSPYLIKLIKSGLSVIKGFK